MLGQTGWWDDKVMTNREARWYCCNAFSKEVVSCIIPPKKADENMMHHHGILPPYSDSKVLHSSPHPDKFSGWEQVGKSHSSLFPLCPAPFLPINFYIHNRQIAGVKLSCSTCSIKQGSQLFFFVLFCFKLSPWLKRNSGRLISHMFSFTNSPVQGFLRSNFVT